MKNLINKEFYNMPGIYQIKNTKNSKIYIGSAFNLYARFRVHKSNLESGKHDNKHLQRSYFKYGSSEFIFEVVEICDIDKIYDIERLYIEKYYGEMCYNINKETNPSNALLVWNDSKKKKFSLIGPDDDLYEFVGYQEASVKTNCSVTFISKVVNKKCKSCKGWRLPENINYDYKNFRSTKNRGAKTHNVKFLGPDGEVYGPIFNMKKFAKEHNLNPSIFFNIIVGKTRYSNGWSLFTGDYIKPLEKNAKEYNVTLISPDGEEFSNIRNLTKFCKEKKISISSIRELINGKIKKKSYKGWKLKNKK